jgi:hypothetical protein
MPSLQIPRWRQPLSSSSISRLDSCDRRSPHQFRV